MFHVKERCAPSPVSASAPASVTLLAALRLSDLLVQRKPRLKCVLACLQDRVLLEDDSPSPPLLSRVVCPPKPRLMCCDAFDPWLAQVAGPLFYMYSTEHISIASKFFASLTTWSLLTQLR